jgi:hypothetical protein
MVDLMDIMSRIASILCSLFYHGFGDPTGSQAGNLSIPTGDTDWHALCTMSYPSILYLRNTSVDIALTQEIQYTHNKNIDVGGRIAYDKTLVLDRCIGTIYVKRYDGAAPVQCDINWTFSELKHSDQNV